MIFFVFWPTCFFEGLLRIAERKCQNVLPNHLLGVLNISSNKNIHFLSKPYPFYRNWEIWIGLIGFFLIHNILVPKASDPVLKV